MSLVTGVAGFVGSHLAESLIDQGHTVLGVDCFSDYYPRSVKLSNLAALREKKAFRFVEADLSSTDISKLLDGVEFVFHLAAQPGVRASWGDSFERYVKDNITATQRLLEAAKSKTMKKIVYASSSSIYGDSEQLPTPEETLPRPVSPYGTTKLAAENLCNVYWRNFNLPTVVLRYFTVYGPRQRPDMAFYKFIKGISSGEEILIYGDGSQSRDFTYVADTVSATISALGAPSGSTFNVGSGRTVSLNETISMIESLVGRRAKKTHVEGARGDVKDTSADITRIQRELNYVPRTSLRDGLMKQIEWLVSSRRA